jgi:formiminotetrahydrofolate cyclodeaminase
MVANLTIGKKGYEAVEGEMKAAAAELRPLREKLLRDMDRDADAYGEVFAAFKLAKNTDAEKRERGKAIQDRLKRAVQVPWELAEGACHVLEIIRGLAAHGNTNAASDADVAATMARSAVLSALANVRINLGSVKDEAFVRAMRTGADRLEAGVRKLEGEILSRGAA